jgi:hypothetical protein
LIFLRDNNPAINEPNKEENVENTSPHQVLNDPILGPAHDDHQLNKSTDNNSDEKHVEPYEQWNSATLRFFGGGP